MSPQVPDKIGALPLVSAIERLRLYDISYNGLPARFGGAEAKVAARHGALTFLPGLDRAEILAMLPTGNFAVVSEPFANKHHVSVGDSIEVTVGSGPLTLEVLGIYYDYSSERGTIMVDRSTLLKRLPDPAVSSVAIYLRDPSRLEEARGQIERAVAGYHVVMFSNRTLREEALKIFDRTFAITWALEAVAILVAVLGIAGALLTLVIDRRREIGLLRFLGSSSGQLRQIILCEAGMLGLLSNLAGFGLGWILSLILINVINLQSFGWTIAFHWPQELLFYALSAIFLATLLSGLYPAQTAIRLNPIEVIHEE